MVDTVNVSRVAHWASIAFGAILVAMYVGSLALLGH